jgi:hypothetical protein
VGIIRRPYYKRGSHNIVSDLDGQLRKVEDCRMQWNGLFVGKEEWSPKQPQQDLRPRPDNPARFPVRNAEPRTVSVVPSQLSAEVLSSSDVSYAVGSTVLSSSGGRYVVSEYVLDSDGDAVLIFGYDYSEISVSSNTYLIPPPVNVSQMI